MIEVTCIQNGDWAEAPCPASAVVAALTLADDAMPRLGGRRGRRQGAGLFTFRFEVEGRTVAIVDERALWAAK
jgi:hypothetical protein